MTGKEAAMAEEKKSGWLVRILQMVLMVLFVPLLALFWFVGTLVIHFSSLHPGWYFLFWTVGMVEKPGYTPLGG